MTLIADAAEDVEVVSKVVGVEVMDALVGSLTPPALDTDCKHDQKEKKKKKK